MTDPDGSKGGRSSKGSAFSDGRLAFSLLHDDTTDGVCIPTYITPMKEPCDFIFNVRYISL